MQMPDNHRGRKIIDLMQKRHEKIRALEQRVKEAREKQAKEEVERAQRDLDAYYRSLKTHVDPLDETSPRRIPVPPRIENIPGPSAPLQHPHPPNITEFPKREK